LANGADPHVDRNACFIDAATLGFSKILLILSSHWDEDLATEILLIALENDDTRTVELLLKLGVRADSEALSIAMQPLHQNRKDSHGRSSLSMIISHDRNLLSVMQVSKTAAHVMTEYLQSQIIDQKT